MDTPSFPLIRTKLHIPGRRARLVPRPRLLDLLDNGPLARLLLVTAPAGFGKTTLVVDWLHHTGASTVWYSLDERDNDFTRFLIYLISAVQMQLPAFGQELLASLLQSPLSSDQLAMDALLSELASFPVEFVLVLDDYHLIHNAEIHRHMATLIDYLPPQVRLAMTSRKAPELPLSRWRAREQMVELTAAELRFDDQEIQDFLRTTMKLNLPDQAIIDLGQRTEGWAAGLQLGALSVRGASDQMASIQRFTGSDRYVSDYLISEVMAQQSASVQKFLEYTSILEQFNSSLCDDLLETDKSQHWLETIDRENLFLVALDNQRKWYRYHHLFGELLRNRLLRKEGADGVARLHCRAANWYAGQGQIDDAIRHALAGGDAPTAARLVADTSLEMLWQSGGVGAICRWVDELPESALRAHPRAALIGAFASLLIGDIPATNRYTALTENAPECDAERKLIQAIFARNEGRMDKALSLLQTASRQLGPDQWLPKTIAQLQIAIAHLELGELNQSATLLREIKRELHIGSQAGLTMMLQTAAFECIVASLRGDMAEAKRIGQEAVAAAQTSSHIAPMVGQIHASLAAIAYMQNDLDAAQAELDRALHWGERTGITDILFNAYDTQIKLHCARGEREQVVAPLQRVRRLYENSRFPDMIRMGRAEEAAIHLRLGNLVKALAWAAESNHDLADPVDPRSRSIYHILANVHLADAQVNRNLSRLDEIVDLARRLTEQTVQLGQILPQISARLLQTQALSLQGKPTEARKQLDQALALAEPGRFIRVFPDSSPSLLKLLRPLSAEQPGNAFLTAVIQSFEMSNSTANALVDPLTEREMEVLGLIAVGLTNKAIEKQLVVSHNTVRTHIKNLYSKLAVSSRTQAVRKGQELGLI